MDTSLDLTKPLNERDNRITFREDIHKYYVDGVKMSCSVTELIHRHFSEFDDQAISRKMLKRKDFFTEQRYSKYWKSLEGLNLDKESDFEKAVDIILGMWEKNRLEASGAGTAMHESIEKYLVFGTPLPDTVELGYFKAFHAKRLSQGYISFRSEQKVFCKGYGIAGSVDKLYTRPEWLLQSPIKVYLMDWKRSKELRRDSIPSDKYGKWPCHELLDCNYEHYTLQLNIYKFLLEKHYNIKVVKMAIVFMHPNFGKAMCVPVKCRTKTVRRMLEGLGREQGG